MFLILLLALLCKTPLSLVKWRLINYCDDDDELNHTGTIRNHVEAEA